ncbi:MAG: zinc-ribbon domain-containing protein [Solobacterium sp.]|nr:zinc-ribbon domain-containing protein [Solobacterium sp.]
MKCPNCGRLLPEEARFCKYCGTPIQTHRSGKSEKGKMSILPVLLAAVLVMCGLAGGGMYLMRRNDSRLFDNSPKPVPENVPDSILVGKTMIHVDVITNQISYTSAEKYQYSDNGLTATGSTVTEHTDNGEDAKIISTAEYTLVKPYDISSASYSKRTVEHSDGSTGTSETCYEFDENGQIISSRSGENLETGYEYDENGRVTYKYYKDKTIEEKQYITWNPDGTIAYIKCYRNGEESTEVTIYYIYDDQGRETASCTVVGSPDYLMWIDTNYKEYDSDGNILKERKYQKTVSPTIMSQTDEAALRTVDYYFYTDYEGLDHEPDVYNFNVQEEIPVDDYSMFLDIVPGLSEIGKNN